MHNQQDMVLAIAFDLSSHFINNEKLHLLFR